MTTLVIIDDEKGVKDAIMGMVEHHLPDTKVIGTANGVETGIELIQRTNPDIILLDIKVEDGTGFTLLQKLTNNKAKIIFITAYDEYAIKAIKFNALDYILKPIDPDDLLLAIQKANQLLDKENQTIQIENLLHFLEGNKQTSKKILLKTSESIILIEVANIIRCEAQSNYTSFFFNGGKTILVSKTLKEYEEMLHDCGFFRVHQSHLINLSYFERYEKRDGGFVVLKDSSIVPISTRKKDEFLELLEKYEHA